MLKSIGSAKKIIFLTIFLDLVGFGIYITLGPYLARHFQASAFEIGWLMSIFSITQFLFSPFWGGLSDRFGRRPILLMSLIGGSLSYFALAFATSFWWLLVCRGLAGVFAANISTAYAAITDITSEKDRAAGMGLLGAAFGLGFIVGPSLGSLFGYLGGLIGSSPPWGIFFPALMAGLITGLNFLWAYKALPETRTQKELSKKKGFTEKLQTLAKESKTITWLLWIFFMYTLAMPLMEVMLFPLVDDLFGWSFVEAGLGFAYVGIVMALTQGYFVRKLSPKWGERKMLTFGGACMSLSFFMISVTGSVAWLALAMTLLALGSGFMRPAVMAMISLATSKENQGLVIGTTQSLSALTRIVGPLLGGWLYDSYGQGSPFFMSGCFALVAFLSMLMIFKNLPCSLVDTKEEATHA